VHCLFTAGRSLLLGAGATLWLPVQIAGANLYVGDLHACMGQGEGALVAIESSGAATVRVDLVKGMGMYARE
jgi:amidase